MANSFPLAVTPYSNVCNVSFIQHHNKPAVGKDSSLFLYYKEHGFLPHEISKKAFPGPRHSEKVCFNFHYLIQVIHKHLTENHAVSPAFCLSARSLSAWETRRYSGLCSRAV